MKNQFSKLAIAVVIMITAISCSKEGLQGPAGIDGKDGNANIMYSDWITYSDNAGGTSTYKEMRVNIKRYTNGFVDSGGFYIAFVRWQDNVHHQLPFAGRFNSTSSPIVEISATGVSFSDEGELRFTAYRQDRAVIQSEFTNLIAGGDLEVRYFLIKGTTNLRLAHGTSLQDYYKSKSYEEICTITGAKP